MQRIFIDTKRKGKVGGRTIVRYRRRRCAACKRFLAKGAGIPTEDRLRVCDRVCDKEYRHLRYWRKFKPTTLAPKGTPVCSFPGCPYSVGMTKPGWTGELYKTNLCFTHHNRYLKEHGLRTCPVCRDTFPKGGGVFSLLALNHGPISGKVCSEACKEEREQLIQYASAQKIVCIIVKKHDADLSADHDRLDIERFLRTPLEDCKADIGEPIPWYCQDCGAMVVSYISPRCCKTEIEPLIRCRGAFATTMAPQYRHRTPTPQLSG